MKSPNRLGWRLCAAALVLVSTTGLTDARAERPPVIDTSNLRVRAPKLNPAPRSTAPEEAPRSVPAEAQSCALPTGPWPSEEGALLEEPITEAEREEVALQIARCSRSVHRVADPWRVLALYRLEEQLAVPSELRGIFGAIWCIEGGMRSEASAGGPIRGDLDARGRPMALGPFQGHGWLWKWCGLEVEAADDLFQAARCYWSRVVNRHASLKGRCGKRDWRVAEALTANGPKYLPEGCKAASGHVRELDSWRKWERLSVARGR